ncbi:hypothetical protein QNH48_04070 [Neobacillus sp. YX16]|uniref:hypothetical protein n=1 Tax=Neobacillus sp. YX16 TaxID=3047874 RepID=UPI0024C22FBF|nr:hypothetical protein [Neobacillus sp. YX16]WHZ03850.1 hypothetical protein QNH48_04070 [Neobacillus sp. YX16]
MIFSLKGDAHKVFLRLKKTINNGDTIRETKEFKEIEEIQTLYLSLDSDTLQLIHYRMIKEYNGSGIIPILVSSAPWLLLLFSKQLAYYLFKDGSWLWAAFCIVYLLTLGISVLIHFCEKAWAAFHMEIIQDILKDRKNENAQGHSTN